MKIHTLILAAVRSAHRAASDAAVGLAATEAGAGVAVRLEAPAAAGAHICASIPPQPLGPAGVLRGEAS